MKGIRKKEIASKKNILVYSHDMYFQDKTNYISNLIGPALKSKEFEKRTNAFYLFRGGSKVDVRKLRYREDILTIFHDISVKFDRIYRILVIKFTKTDGRGKLENFYWKVVLKLLNIKLVIGIEPSIELCKSARGYGIKTIDIEHGMRSSQSYFYRSDYRYDNKGYPDIITISTDGITQELVNKLPSYVTLKHGIDTLFIAEYNNTNMKKIAADEESRLLVIDQYLTRGSEHSHILYKKIFEYDGKIRVRIHPKFRQTKLMLEKKVCEYNKIFKERGRLEDLEIDINSVLLEDMLLSKGLVTYSSACYKKSLELGLPTFVYGMIEEYEVRNGENAFGFQYANESSEWHKFIRASKNTTKPEAKALYDEKVSNLASMHKQIIEEWI